MRPSSGQSWYVLIAATDQSPGSKFCDECGRPLGTQQTAQAQTSSTAPSASSLPTSFANGRYQVKKFLGEGGKKKVYLAHDTRAGPGRRLRPHQDREAGRDGPDPDQAGSPGHGQAGRPPQYRQHLRLSATTRDSPTSSSRSCPVEMWRDSSRRPPTTSSPSTSAIEIARSVCKGLEFAHAKGIIHRDIKPGNVWLSADGTAKVGDFGLAVAVDLSRLTQVGMMVGTVSYMPPEQAMGGKVTAKADLYSLGAMLYEMVTGRPPFVGDDSVAIIGQHINTPPVSPTWHRADLPPALETLIMQLLEKDPEKRPASATVVLQALESIGTGKATKEPAPRRHATPAENPLYRRVFVGREAELKQLQSAFDGAMSGQGALMMVLGEPGIGKTALCEQLATYVTLRGGRTLVGHCYEEGSLSLPYLAFVEAMRSYVLDREAEDLRKELGSGATDVARIVSEIREKLQRRAAARRRTRRKTATA